MHFPWAHQATVSRIVHLCKLAKLESIVALVTDPAMDPLPHMGNYVFQSLPDHNKLTLQEGMQLGNVY